MLYQIVLVSNTSWYLLQDHWLSLMRPRISRFIATGTSPPRLLNALQPELQSLIGSGVLPAGTTLQLDFSDVRKAPLEDGSLSADIPAIVLSVDDGSIVTAVGLSNVSEQLSGEFDIFGVFDSFIEETTALARQAPAALLDDPSDEVALLGSGPLNLDM